jgi:hypothetical protein
MQEQAQSIPVSKRTAQFGVLVIVTLIVTCLAVLIAV